MILIKVLQVCVEIDIPFEPTKRSQMYQPKTSILKEVIFIGWITILLNKSFKD